MIGYLQGKVKYSDGEICILLLSSGIGYKVFFSDLLLVGENLEIYISSIYRENTQDLFGHRSWSEKKVFDLLLKVKGVGPKIAYLLLTRLGISNLQNAILMEDKAFFTKVPGVGNKMANQILLDLKDKISDLAPTEQSSNQTNSHYLQDALLACKELGLNEKQILPIAQKIMGKNTSEIKNPAELVTLILKEI